MRVSRLSVLIAAAAFVVGSLSVSHAASSVVAAILAVGNTSVSYAVPYGSSTTTDPHYAAPKFLNAGGTFTLEASITKATSFSGTSKTGIGGFSDLVVTLDVTSAERDTGNETYDFYITTGDGVSSWDVVHFPQIAATGAKRYTAIVSGKLLPQTVTTAGPGVAAVMSGTMKTDTGGSNEGIKTLTAGMTRHGVWGDRIGYELVEAGTIVTGIVYSITVTAK